MKKETYKELGKAFNNFGTITFGIAVLQPVVQGKVNIPLLLLFLMGVIGFLVGGTILIEKGANND
ncbi:MAG: hypothetical protein JRJ38_03015 [Deltaproteobacteria bacterium]|nr:hypothetical protein [Deltaproteobacteria bacterium]